MNDSCCDSGAWIIHGPRLLYRRRSGPRSCIDILRKGYKEADVVRSARPLGKKMAIIINKSETGK